MIKLKSVSMSNFFAFGRGPFDIDLEDIGHVMVKGVNKDIGDSGDSSNGAAKTSCMQAIVFALYGKGIDKIKPDEMVNIYNKKNCVVTLDLEIGGTGYTIRRGRKPSFVEFKQGDKDLSRDSMKNTDASIQDLIGIPYEVFMGIYFMNIEIPTFMSMTSAEQRNYIESVLSLDVLVKRSESLKSKKKDIETNIKLTERDLSNVTSQTEKMQSNLDRLRMKHKAFEDERESDIRSMEETLSEASEIDFEECLNESVSISESMNSLNGMKSSVEMKRLKLDSLNKELDSIQNKIDQMQSIKNLYDQFERKRNETQQSLEEKISQYKEESWYLSQMSLIEESKVLSDQLKDKRDRISVAKSRLDEFTRDAERILDEVDRLEAGKCPYCDQEHYDKDKVSDLKAKLGECEEELDARESSLRIIETELEDTMEYKERVDSEIEEGDPEKDLDELKRIKKELEVVPEQENPYSSQLKDNDEEIRQQEDDIRQEISEITNELNDLLDELRREEDKVEERRKKIEDILGTDKSDEIRGMKSEFDGIKQAVSDLRSKDNPYADEIENAKLGFPDVESVEKELKDLEKQKVHINYLIKLLTDPKSFVRKNIVDQYIPFVNKKINEYSEELGLSHVSEIKPDMTVEVQYMRENVSYYNMSKGERLRLNLATSLAFKDLLELLGKSINLCMVDEYLDSSLDKSGMMRTFKILTKNLDNIMMISHRDDFASEMDKVITITKENSFSSIEVS